MKEPKEDIITSSPYTKITSCYGGDGVIISVYHKENLSSAWELSDDYTLDVVKFEGIRKKIEYFSMKYRFEKDV